MHASYYENNDELNYEVDKISRDNIPKYILEKLEEDIVEEMER